MYPIICRIGPFTLYSYGLMLVAAFAISTALALEQAKRCRINPEIIFNLAFAAFIAGVAGSRIFYVLENWDYYWRQPLEIIMLQRGGLSWFGGLILGAIGGIAYLKKKKLPIYRILDLIVPFLALAQAIGRIGCLLNGCCFGYTVVPVQIYSSCILLFIFMVLRFLQDKPHKEGTILFTYLVLYSVKRFFIEFWRADNEIIFFGLTLFQIISIAVFFISLAGLIFILRPTKK